MQMQVCIMPNLVVNFIFTVNLKLLKKSRKSYTISYRIKAMMKKSNKVLFF